MIWRIHAFEGILERAQRRHNKDWDTEEKDLRKALNYFPLRKGFKDRILNDSRGGGAVKRSVVLLFGAGASFGSGGLWNRPPLSKDLLGSLSSEYPGTWGHIPSKIRMSFEDPEKGIDFERGMGRLYQCQVKGEITNLAELLKDMGRFFSHFSIVRYDSNQYYKILTTFKDSILAGEIILVTLNYECLIELAASKAGMKTIYWGDSTGARLLKLHGSCNFILPSVSGTGKFILGSGTIRGPLAVIDPQSVDTELDSRPAPPAMSLFNIEKTDLICPDKLLDLRKEYEESVRSAELAIVVGVYPRLAGDIHVWNPLKSMNGKLGIVDKSDLVAKWRSIHRSNRDDPVLPEEFIDAYPDICSLIRSVL